MINTLSLLLGNTQKTVSNWKKEKRPIMKLLYQYFTKEELEEFLESGRIAKFENIQYIFDSFLPKQKQIYLNSFISNPNFKWKSIVKSNNIFIDFYFSFLVEFPNLKVSSFQDKIHLFLNQYSNSILQDRLTIQKIKDDIKRDLETDVISDDTMGSIINLSINAHGRDVFNILQHFGFYNGWGDDMCVFISYLIKDDFDYFIKSGDKELLIHSIGYLYYKYLYVNGIKLKEEKKMDIHFKVESYFLANLNEVSVLNIKNKIKQEVY